MSQTAGKTVSEKPTSDSNGPAAKVIEVPTASSPKSTTAAGLPHAACSDPYRWKIYWTAPAQMVGLFLVGVILATGHHVYYNSLVGRRDGNPSQQWANRYGTAFTFLVRTFLVSAVATAYAQQFWFSARRKDLPIGTLDAMFGAIQDPMAFLDMQMLRKAKLGTLVALVAWIIPWATVVPPSTLFVVPEIRPDFRNMPLQLPNFTAAESFATFVMRVPLDDGITTPFSETAVYNAPFPSLSRLAVATMAGGDIPPIVPPTQNASYTMVFYGPSLSCEVANESKIAVLNQTMQVNPYEYALIWPSLTYHARMDEQMQLLVGWVTWDNIYLLHGVVCSLYNVSYTVEFDFVNDVQVVNLKDRTVVNRTAIGEAPDVPGASSTGIDGLHSHIYDPSLGWNFRTISYVAMRSAFFAIVGGNISASPELDAGSWISNTRLMFGPDLYDVYTRNEVLYPELTVKTGMEELWTNFTMSLFSTTARIATMDQSTDVTASLIRNIFHYNAVDLLLSYFISALATLIAVLVGLRALRANRVSHSTSFSSILQTTRNAELDHLVRSGDGTCQCLAAAPLDQSVKKTQLKFGVAEGHFAFQLTKKD